MLSKYNTDETELAIQLILSIEYDESDDLCNLSEFIVDLDPLKKNVNLLFECEINKDKLIEDIAKAGNISKEKFIKKYLTNYLEKSVYTFDDLTDLKKEHRHKLVRKNFKNVKSLIDFEIIHAKRSVSSSEEKHGMKVLSGLTTSYFNGQNTISPDKFESINKLIETMDGNLNKSYDDFFNTFLKNARDFLGMGDLKVISNLKANEIISDASEVVYGNDVAQLPEYLNGLGHLNVLYLLLNIEIKKKTFAANNKEIKLLFIEEPEAHTHPQLQHIFARKIEEIVSGISGMQTIITTHSSHIVANHPFENIVYMSLVKSEDNFFNIEIKNFHEELSKKYSAETDEFQFIKQYLSTDSAELFFADKAIFIEGISEGMLLQHFISQYDSVQLKREKQEIDKNPSKKATYIPLSAQNITVIQAGSNAKAFRHFLDFLQIPAIIITDIDTVKKRTIAHTINYIACEATNSRACKTSNGTICYYLSAPKYIYKDKDYKKWFKKLVNHKLKSISSYVYVTYQKKEGFYHARSFEDAFINVNLDQIKGNIDLIEGLKNKETFNTCSNLYKLTQKVIDKKSEFASSLLFLTYAKNIRWKMPSYIWEGLEWLQKQ